MNAAPYKRPESVLVVIHSADGAVLLLERSRYPGFWQSVTGSLENNERPVDAALREVAEETGIAAATPASAASVALTDWQLSYRFTLMPQWRHRYAPMHTHNLEHVFSLCLPSACSVRIAPNEHRAARWLPWKKAAAACFSWSNRDAILLLALRQAWRKEESR